ncbi:MAG: AraC family transcriptional regulator [Treponemataceae bacterium]|nr:AraC family transcriptional regulator [Treponemataceae bacterium]
MSINKNVVIKGKTIELRLDKNSSISNSYGKIDLKKVKERENIIYHSWNVQVETTTFAQEKDNCGRDEVQIMFNLNQDINWFVNKNESSEICEEKGNSGNFDPCYTGSFNTGTERVEMAKGEVCVFRNNNYSTAMNYEAGINFNFKSLQMPTPYFRDLLSKYFSNQNISELEEHFLTHVTKTVITPEMYRVLSEIDTADRFKEYEGVYTEGKMIELTALVLYGIAYHKTDEIKRVPQPNKSDAERVESLREKIQRNPALEYDAQTVADELGMSISKLNRVFRTMYATSLHSYVQEKRLECAAKLLQENNIAISEAAQKSGYSNMSHFSKSFLKKYGVLPKDF